MRLAIHNEIVRLGGDPSDEIWHWFATRGPYGPSFTWGQTRNNPAGYVGVDHLRKIVDEMSASVPSFQARALQIVNAALESSSSEFVRRAIQIAAVLGGISELERIKPLVSSQDASVASDARACAFYLKRRC